MSSFQKLWENIQLQKENSSQKESKSMSAIRNGIGIRENFWDDFLQLINGSEDLSELLDVPVSKISLWHEKIHHALEKVKKADSSLNPKDNSKLLKTGLPDMPDPENIIQQR